MEMWDLLGPGRTPLGRLIARSQRDGMGPDEFHLIVEVWTADQAGHILVTRRHPDKEFPLLWENTGGSALAGEDSLSAAQRELWEETGLKAQKNHLRLFFSRQETRAFLDAYFFRVQNDVSVALQPGETIDYRWIAWDELMELSRQGLLSPHVTGRLEVYGEQLHSLIMEK